VDGDILPSGGAAAIDLRLRALPGTPSHPRVSLRLVDEHGDTWVQYDQDMRLPSDGPASSAPLDDRHGLLVPPGTPPGTYSLYLDAYSPSGALTAQGEGAPIDPGGVRLETIRVESPARVAWTDDLSDFQSLKASFPEGLDLLGYTATPAIQAGQSGGLTLLWTTDATSLQVSRLRLTLQAPDGKVAETRDLAFATPSFPTDQWRPGDVVREQYRLPVASSLAPGSYRLSVLPVFDSPGSAASRGEAAGPPVADSAHLGLVQVLANPHPTSTTPPGHPLADTLGQSISLDGYDLASDHVRPGGDLDLTLHWRDLASVDTDYTVFVHLLDASEKVVAQRDQPPVANQRPTSSWFAGDTVLDRYQIPLPPTLPPGDYAIEVGMYQPNDGKRLAVRSDGAAAGDRIVLGKIHVGS
jgi:hypothetical protein